MSLFDLTTISLRKNSRKLNSVSLKIEPLQYIAIFYNGSIFNETDFRFYPAHWIPEITNQNKFDIFCLLKNSPIGSKIGEHSGFVVKNQLLDPVKIFLKKFIYSEQATKFCEIFTLLLSYVVPVKSKVKISQNFVAFSEYMNFKKT